MKRESKPHYLQDTVLLKESEKPHKSWDPDREFRPGTQERMVTALANYIKDRLANYDNLDASRYASDFRILTGTPYGTSEEQERMLTALTDYVKDLLVNNNDLEVSWRTADLRILRAHDIKFIPGKGIEIIDDPPEVFEKKTEPIPEERKF